MTYSPAARTGLVIAALALGATGVSPAADRPQCILAPPQIPGLATRGPRSILRGGGTAEAQAAATGTLHLLVVLAEFSDMPHRIAAARFPGHLFGSGLSLASYYDEVSAGRLEVTGDVFGWFTLPQDEFYYSAGLQGVGAYPHNGQRLAEDAVAAAISGGVDLRNYDANGDDVVDALLVIHSGEGYEWAQPAPNSPTPVPDPNAINSHKWVVVDGDFGAGLPRVADYFTGPELQRARTIYFPAWTDSIATIGVFCHELGHVLGLPDVYDVQTAESRIGDWEIMDAGTWTYVSTDPPVSLPGALPSHFSAWARMFLGWADVDVVAPPVGELFHAPLTLTSASTGSLALQLLTNPGGVDWSQAAPGAGEYFVAEVRTRHGFDRGLPGEGLLVYHVDEGRRDNVVASYADGGGLLMLAPQDGHVSSSDDDTDPWPGAQTVFGPNSNPSSNFHGGSPSGVTLADISPLAGESVSLVADVLNLSTDLALPFARPNPWYPERIGEASLILSLAPSPGAASVSLFDARGRRVRTLDAPSEFTSPGWIARWDGRSDDGTKLPAGVYFFRVHGSAAGAGKILLLR